MLKKNKILLISVIFSAIFGCSFESNEKIQQLISDEWICDSIQTNHLTYLPENNGVLFYKKGVRITIKYSSDGTINMTGQRQNFSKYIIKDSLLYVIQENINDSIKKIIIKLDNNKMILQENATICNNVVYRGSFVGKETIKLFYTKK
jgi:hypothetical protein